MTLTQAQYKLWTGQAPNYGINEWNQIVIVAAARLASFLCLPNGLPTDPNSVEGFLPVDLQQLLANFIAGVIANQGARSEVESKHVRNFTINFKSTTASDAFANIAQKYADIIDLYSNCGTGFAVERNAYYGCERGCACRG